MSNTVKVACCGVLSAFATAVMLLTNLPIFLYTIPIIAATIFIVPTIEFGTKWGVLCYAVTALLSLILPTEKEAVIVFIGILGYYPIIKMVIERLGKRPIELLLKLLTFNVAIVASYAVIIKIMGLNPFQNEFIGETVAAGVTLVIGNAVFLLLDYALTKVIVLYFIKFRKTVKRVLRLDNRN